MVFDAMLASEAILAAAALDAALYIHGRSYKLS